MHAHTPPTHHLSEKLIEASMAVGLVFLILEGSLVELLKAESTHKMLRVELFAHSCYAAASDGLLAA